MEIEEKAKKMGHVPKEEWKGDPDKWRPAEEFVERGESILPIVKERLDKTEKNLENLKKDLDITLKANKREVEVARKESYDLAIKNYEKDLKALDVKELEAFSEGDADKFQEAKTEKSKLKVPIEPKAVVEPKQTPSPEFEEWSSKETWYKQSDPSDELTAEMDIQTNVLVNRYPNKSIKEIFELATKNVKKLHSDKFKNPRREEAQSVDNGEPTPNTNTGETFADLPKSAKDTYKRLAAQFKAKGREYKKEDYALDYYS